MIFPEIAFAISLLFGLHVLIQFLLKKPAPVFSVLLHIFGFLVGFILLTTSGDTWENGVLSASSALLIVAFFSGFMFLLLDTISFKPPSKLLGVGYMTLLAVGLILMIIK
ncbi:MAG: hypothetical protein P8Z35_13665 [Ignavibacteriaceae bacterium]